MAGFPYNLPPPFVQFGLLHPGGGAQSKLGPPSLILKGDPGQIIHYLFVG